ncbi:hypothetical protein [Actinopolymorpha pittospori]
MAERLRGLPEILRGMAETNARLAALTERMAALGADDPEGWARSEINENIPQQARYLVLRRVWEDIVAWREPEVLGRVPPAARLLAEGASPATVTTALMTAAYEAAFAVVSIVDEGCDPEAPDDAPGWALVEVDPGGRPTGRDVGGLHEDLLGTDPSGQEGRDFLS